MGWQFDSESPKRDTSVSVEEEIKSYFGTPEPIPWRYKFVRLWRFLTRR
mgnify:FL=1